MCGTVLKDSINNWIYFLLVKNKKFKKLKSEKKIIQNIRQFSDKIYQKKNCLKKIKMRTTNTPDSIASI